MFCCLLLCDGNVSLFELYGYALYVSDMTFIGENALLILETDLVVNLASVYSNLVHLQV